MEQFQPVLLDVWREACRQIEINRSVAAIAPLLRNHIPIEQLYVRRVVPEKSLLETLAWGFPGLDREDDSVRSSHGKKQIDQLLGWCGNAEIGHGSTNGEDRPAWRIAIPEPTDHHVLVSPIGDPANQAGVLVIVAPPAKSFSTRDIALAKTLQAPLSAAFRNDHQFRELMALREAAEAQKQSLLVRLGRKTLADTIVGQETGLRHVIERVNMVASSDLPVLILGETGTGKELVARTIHKQSSCCAGPIIRVNCGAIPPELIDSELFGHERGAFTGAVETRRGWFERANGGTLFLDEIGDMPLAAQVRLLRILQDGWFERVGGASPIHVRVRVVAATHRDLAQMVAQGAFREDLWYRLSVFPILLPPLRERVSDIPELARHFAEKAATRFGLLATTPSPEDTRLLASYAWPGNVRELAAVIDRAAILGNGKQLEVAKALGMGAIPPPCTNNGNMGTEIQCPVVAPLDDVMRSHIETALAASKGRIEGPFGAAAALKINPHTLRARMRKLGIDWKRFR